MNAKVLLLTAALAVGIDGQNADEPTVPQQLPPAVQQTLQKLNENGPINKIVRRKVEGRTFFEVEFEQKNAINPRVRIGEDGTIVSSASVVGPVETAWPALPPDYGSGAVPDNSPLRLEDLPQPVRATVLREAAGREIADIDRETWRRQTVYETEFKQEGRNSRIHVAADGTLLQDEPRPKGIRDWFKGTQIEDTPRPVQETVQRESAGREVVDIDRQGLLGREPTYKIELRAPNGKTAELHVAADGAILNHNHANATR